MRGVRRMRICVFALAVLLTAALPVSAQLTTGSVGGTIKDPQGAVVPGATVTLVSETRGTKSVPVITNAAGDFVFPNIPADTYTIEVEMPSFKTLRQSGISVNPGPQVSVGALTLEVGGATETVSVKGESPVIQTASGERSFAIPTETVENLPFASRSFLQLGALAPGVVMNGTQVQRLGSIVQSTTVMMDGVSTMDTGSNGAIIQMNTESIAEVKILVQGYQAEYGRSSGLQITAVSKSGTNRFRGSRSTTCGATPTGTPTARRTSSTSDPQADPRSSRKSAIRSAARSGSRAATTSCSSSTRSSSCRVPAGTTS